MFLIPSNQKGFSLAEVMIGAALMGGVALITAKLMGDQAASQAQFKARSEMAKMTSALEAALNNTDTCKRVLGGVTYALTGTSMGTAGTDAAVLQYTLPDRPAVKVLLGENDYGDFIVPNAGIVIKNSVYDTPAGGSMIDLNLSFMVKQRGFLVRGSNPDAPDLIRKSIPIVVQTDNLGGGNFRIRECGPVLGDANVDAKRKMCDSLIAANVAIWNGTRCELISVKCPFGQIAIKMTSLGGIICADIKDQVNLQDLFDMSGVDCAGKPNLRIDNVGGKFKINCYP